MGFRKFPLIWMTLLVGLGWSFPAHSLEWSGFVGGEVRSFFEDGLHDEQERSDQSLLAQPELFHEWDDGSQFLFVPFARIDFTDEDRTHFDIRELFWGTFGDNWELFLGVRKVFWGVTESQHLVDIVNQTDLVENPNGEQKLGQPMIQFSWIHDIGNIDFFVLPGFRERTFPGEEGRLRFPLEVDTENSEFEAKEESSRVDFAVRAFQTIDDLDIGISFFSGTSRDPDLEPGLNDDQELVLIPHYRVIQQLGLEAQWILDDWLLKLEAITRQNNQDDRYTAYTTGFEYTFANVSNSGADIGVLLEYLYDDRHEEGGTPFEQDVFSGIRIALNDEQSTEFLGGFVADVDQTTRTWLIESNRRFGESTKITLEANGFMDVEEDDPLFSRRKDSFVKLEVAQFF